ncbi:MAG: SH3 domain-containing protein [Saprospiraceae bacterium]|nr:SH3 domain-containing protein [Saprospiraceae bacterium]
MANNGLILRESHSVNSKNLMQLKFGDKVSVIDTLYYGDYIDERQGSWIHVRAKDKTGFMFSGYLTNLKIPKHFQTKQNCLRYDQFEEILTLNTGNLIGEGERKFNSFWEKSKGYSNWKVYDDGTIIQNLFGYEFEDLIVHSYNFNMFDILIYLIIIFRTTHQLQRHKYESRLKNNGLDIESIECFDLRFSAKIIGGQVVIQSNIYEL